MFKNLGNNTKFSHWGYNTDPKDIKKDVKIANFIISKKKVPPKNGKFRNLK